MNKDDACPMCGFGFDDIDHGSCVRELNESLMVSRKLNAELKAKLDAKTILVMDFRTNERAELERLKNELDAAKYREASMRTEWSDAINELERLKKETIEQQHRLSICGVCGKRLHDEKYQDGDKDG